MSLDRVLSLIVLLLFMAGLRWFIRDVRLWWALRKDRDRRRE